MHVFFGPFPLSPNKIVRWSLIHIISRIINEQKLSGRVSARNFTHCLKTTLSDRRNVTGALLIEVVWSGLMHVMSSIEDV